MKVTHLLDGSVQRTGRRVRVIARLTEVSTGRQLWADRYDREDSDVFALQDDIARSVGTALRVGLRGRSGSGPPTSSLPAYDAYLRGRFHYRNFYDERESKSSAEALAAVARFQEAVALDPRFAEAYAALGEAYASIFFYLGPARRPRSRPTSPSRRPWRSTATCPRPTPHAACWPGRSPTASPTSVRPPISGTRWS